MSDLTITTALRPGDREAIVAGLASYNDAHGFGTWEPLDLALLDAGGGGTVRGGLRAHANARWLFVDALWVDEGVRRRGHGTRLIRAAEEEARRRGCLGVYLDTYSFQARPFYERAGYRLIGELPDLPPGGAKYWLAKRLDAPVSERPEQPVLTAARLRLRPFAMDDAPAVRVLAGDHAVADTTLHIPHPYPDGAAEAWIAHHRPAWEAGTLATYAVTSADDGRLFGAVGLTMSGGTMRGAQAELGYWIGKPFWNRGHATEASRALIDFGFRALGLHRVQARHLTRNPASGRVMEKVGMRREGVLRGSVRKNGRFEDVVLYAVLAPEWTGDAS